MKEDLLPVENLSADDTIHLLAEHLAEQGCQPSGERLSRIVREQLQLTGTLILHSETASRNGGDFDFDLVCLVEDNRFPRFVQNRLPFYVNHSVSMNRTHKHL